MARIGMVHLQMVVVLKLYQAWPHYAKFVADAVAKQVQARPSEFQVRALYDMSRAARD